jgi:hypothetical protein
MVSCSALGADSIASATEVNKRCERIREVEGILYSHQLRILYLTPSEMSKEIVSFTANCGAKSANPPNDSKGI